MAYPHTFLHCCKPARVWLLDYAEWHNWIDPRNPVLTGLSTPTLKVVVHFGIFRALHEKVIYYMKSTIFWDITPCSLLKVFFRVE
jgi:hypothetical protein